MLRIQRVCAGFESLKEDLPRIMHLAVDLLTEPAVPASKLDLAKSQVRPSGIPAYLPACLPACWTSYSTARTRLQNGPGKRFMICSLAETSFVACLYG